MAIPAEQLDELAHAYEVLDVPVIASAGSIKQAYRKLVKRWHPDAHKPGDSAYEQATERMKSINEAYSKIKSAPLRYYRPAQQAANSQRNVPVSSPYAARSQPPAYGQMEFWVRFCCGFLFGFIISLRLMISFGLMLLTSPGLVVAVAITTIGSGLAAARYGDAFWYGILRRWWLWS